MSLLGLWAISLRRGRYGNSDGEAGEALREFAATESTAESLPGQS